MIVGCFFNIFIYRKYHGCWMNYNYLLSGALDVGTALCTVISALALGLAGANMPDWWGTTVHMGSLDFQGNASRKKFIMDSTPPLGPNSW